MGHDIWVTICNLFHSFGRWEGITAISTAAAAIFTAVMAYLTRKAIKEGQGQRKDTNDHFAATRAQDKQHHEDSFRPLLVLAQTDIADTVNRDGTIRVLANDSKSGLVVIKCVIRNIGMGPALNVRLHLRSDGRTGFGPTRELAPIAGGGEYGDSKERLEILAYYHDGFNNTDLANAGRGLWILVLEYEDIFGNSFHTLHCKDRSQPWARAGRGRAPDT
ncbi:hypothetical protein [Rhodanobacter sp. C06]|uniref:hypothetical protein n=1 Tax=Rhodanobacter sp. C06 TaxID=1945854 RepID=UPI00111576BF|nr:hypothetical protein [Rhodanobacter sp. C06]